MPQRAAAQIKFQDRSDTEVCHSTIPRQPGLSDLSQKSDQSKVQPLTTSLILQESLTPHSATASTHQRGYAHLRLL